MEGSNNQIVNLRSGTPFFRGPVFLAKITSAKFMEKLANVQDQRSFQHSKGLVFHNLHLFEEMKQGIEPKKGEGALSAKTFQT